LGTVYKGKGKRCSGDDGVETAPRVDWHSKRAGALNEKFEDMKKEEP